VIDAYRLPHADWADVGVGLLAISVAAAAEGLRLREQLDVRLNADNCLVFQLRMSPFSACGVHVARGCFIPQGLAFAVPRPRRQQMQRRILSIGV
jgi:hypothetical protein